MGYFSDLLCDHPDSPSASRLLGRSAPAVPTLALLHCPCGRLLGSGFCRCGRTFSAVMPRALGVGAANVQPSTSQHAPSGLVAACHFTQFAPAAAFARACPGLFGVVPPFVRRVRGGWLVRVPVSSWS